VVSLGEGGGRLVNIAPAGKISRRRRKRGRSAASSYERNVPNPPNRIDPDVIRSIGSRIKKLSSNDMKTFLLESFRGSCRGRRSCSDIAAFEPANESANVDYTFYR